MLGPRYLKSGNARRPSASMTIGFSRAISSMSVASIASVLTFVPRPGPIAQTVDLFIIVRNVCSASS